MSTVKSTPPITEASRRISDLRKALRLSQEEFAARMGVGRIAALYWESGRSQPSADTYVRMAKVAKEVDLASAVWFWQQVGVDRDALKDLIPEFNKSTKKAEQRVRHFTENAGGSVVVVPLLREVANLNAPTLASEDQIEAWLPLPAVLLQNPSKTSCLRAPKGMASLGLGGNDLLVIDASEVLIERLWDKMVIAKHQSSSESYVGFLQSFEMNNRRIPALSVARMVFRRMDELRDPNKATQKPMESQKEPRSGVLHKPGRFLPMTPKTEWRILGRVVCRIGCERGLDFVPHSKDEPSSGIGSDA